MARHQDFVISYRYRNYSVKTLMVKASTAYDARRDVKRILNGQTKIISVKKYDW